MAKVYEKQQREQGLWMHTHGELPPLSHDRPYGRFVMFQSQAWMGFYLLSSMYGMSYANKFSDLV